MMKRMLRNVIDGELMLILDVVANFVDTKKLE